MSNFIFCLFYRVLSLTSGDTRRAEEDAGESREHGVSNRGLQEKTCRPQSPTPQGHRAAGDTPQTRLRNPRRGGATPNTTRQHSTGAQRTHAVQS